LQSGLPRIGNGVERIIELHTMGLDSVILLAEIEKAFAIEIPNTRAEKINTIGDMCDVIRELKQVPQTPSTLQATLLDRLNHALINTQALQTPLAKTALIFLLIDMKDQARWQSLEDSLGLNIPVPNTKSTRRFLFQRPTYDWETITVEECVDAIATANYSKLITENTKDAYSIYICVRAITVECIGVDEYDVSAGKSFTNDLGID
jgi:acyl carrier protein